MCGIAGVVAPGPVDAHRPLLEAVLESQHPRGPDVRDLQAVAAHALLGHNRLSIIDLSAEANQPMWDRERRCCVVYNGEIYNYLELRRELEARGRAFRTKSDTEVLLEAFKEWGPGAFARFNGMFAFGLLDARDGRLHLVRDRFGVKPLYYVERPDGLFFASTPGALARRFGLEPDPVYLARHLRYRIPDGHDRAPYAGMKALPPGHHLEAGPDGLRLRAWYDLAANVAPLEEALAREPIERLAERVLETLGSAIDLRFRADVPIGLSLSGGLDSSTIAALAARANLVGFSFGHPDDPASEGPLVAAVAAKTGVRVEWIRPSREEMSAAFLGTLEAQGAPFPTASVMAQWLVFKAVGAAGVKVLLGGQGGDEVFMGYRKFQVFHLKRLWRRSKARALAFALSLLPTALAELPQAGLHWGGRKRYAAAPDAGAPPMGDDPSAPSWRRQLTDILDTSLPTLLRFEDRNSMGHSVESRLPFMDYRVVELGLALPVAAKLRKGHGKWILRSALEGRLPDVVRLSRRKRGFDAPQADWIRGGLGEEIRRHAGPAFTDDDLLGRPTSFAEACARAWTGGGGRP